MLRQAQIYGYLRVFLAPDSFHARGIPSRSPAEGSVAPPCVGPATRRRRASPGTKIPRSYTRIFRLDGALVGGTAARCGSTRCRRLGVPRSACTDSPDRPSAPRVVTADVLDLPILQEHDAIRLADGGQPMRDDNHEPISRRLQERAYQSVLGFRVKRRRGFVEDQYWGVSDQSAGYARRAASDACKAASNSW